MVMMIGLHEVASGGRCTVRTVFFYRSAQHHGSQGNSKKIAFEQTMSIRETLKNVEEIGFTGRRREGTARRF
jgi:hypothetical protein